MQAREVAKYIDHTILKADATPRDIEKLCHEANQYGFAAVCVNACYVPLVKSIVHDDIHVASVVGFPLGATSTYSKCQETKQAILDGASEIDMVINIGWAKAGMWAEVEADIRAVVLAAAPVGVKVILETALLNDEEKIAVCSASKRAGAAFVKTSTGFGPAGATLPDVALMRRTVGPDVMVKASGGVRNLDTLLAFVAAGANRIGTSSGVAIVEESQAQNATT
ncbi:MAG: deoxyribose-phosphate aldolase [Firmicutes bacterium]|nr:deoxyribose-phosphate aldolase [Dethiobacter sp.]MBS3888401.1 deoxyribose-phosphate aldolase [Bacillota bacterium]